MPVDFGGIYGPSLELDDERAHYASLKSVLANLIIDYETESLGLMLQTYPSRTTTIKKHVATSI
jgi:hypothetical protein